CFFFQAEDVIRDFHVTGVQRVLFRSFRPDRYQETDPRIYNRNLPIWKTYEPGSTFKIITLAAALEENKVNLKEHFFDPGYAEVEIGRASCREGVCVRVGAGSPESQPE